MTPRSAITLVTMLTFGSTAMADETAELNARTQAAAAVTKEFVTELGGALKAQLQSAGPAAAISVCRDVAPSIATRLSLQNGWQVTRVGTRVRNTMIGTPDPWEQTQLQRFAERAAQGEDYQQMSHAEIVNEPGGRYFRFVKAIPVAEVCLQCHGDRARMAEDVRAALAAAYPHDQAVNYSVGDLRGAVSIKQSLDIPLGK